MNSIDMKLTNLKLYVGSEITGKNDNKKCTLCRQKLNALPLQYLTRELTENDISMNVVVGQCGDMFHMICITDFNKTGNLSCPSCKLIWEVKDTVNGLL